MVGGCCGLPYCTGTAAVCPKLYTGSTAIVVLYDDDYINHISYAAVIPCSLATGSGGDSIKICVSPRCREPSYHFLIIPVVTPITVDIMT